MFKYTIAAFLLLAFIFMSGQANCQEQIKDQQIKSISGEVTHVDLAGGVIIVKTDKGKMVFTLTVQSDLFKFTHHMASIDIQRSDPVNIQYVSSPAGNNIIKLVDNKSKAYTFAQFIHTIMDY